jgi:hypothetical protein
MLDYSLAEPDRRPWPAWAMSTISHVTLFVALALLIQTRTSTKSEDETPRSVGIALATVSHDVPYFSAETSATASATDAAVMTQAKSSPQGENDSPLPDASALAANQSALSSPDLPGEADIGHAGSQGLLQDLVGSGGGRPSILPGLDDAAILANDPILNRPVVNLGPTADMRVFGAKSTGRSFIFLIDRSKSMGGEGLGAIEAAEHELKRGLAALSPSQTFQIIAYNQSLSANSEKLAPADDAHQQAAVKYLAGIVAHGQTEHYMALAAALRAGPEVIYLLSDAGEPPLNDPQIRELTLRAKGKTTIHCIQFGWGELPADPPPFMRKLAGLNGGGFVYVDMSQTTPSRN